jgi:hypothetical protein
MVGVKNHPTIKYVAQSEKTKGIAKDPTKVCWNNTNGASAINLAYHLGAKKIVLLGFDMKKVNGKRNWHDDHLSHKDAPDPYKKYLIPFKNISEDLEAVNVELINTCMDSAIPEHLVPKKEYLEVVNANNR